MMQAVRGIYRGGIVELLESPGIPEEADVVVTFLSDVSSPTISGTSLEQAAAEGAGLLDDFEPIARMKQISLSDIVLQDRE